MKQLILLICSILLFTSLSFANESKIQQVDINFATEAAQGGISEVKMGKLGRDRAQNANVKKYAEVLISDHEKANNSLKNIAENEKIELPKDTSKSQQEHYSLLEGFDSSKFDKNFIGHMIADHKKAIELFETQVQRGSNPKLKSFASETLPTLKAHLEKAQAIENELG